MSSFIIKLIAIITMTIDHVNDIVFNKIVLNIVGRIAFPLFCFQIVVGYAKTKNLKAYLKRLFIFACISQVPYYFFMKIIEPKFSTNVMFTFFLGIIAIIVYDLKINNSNGIIEIIDYKGDNLLGNYKLSFDRTLVFYINLIRVLVIALIMLFSEMINTDYSTWGIIVILFIHAFYPLDGNINIFSKEIKINKWISKCCFIMGFLCLSFIKYMKYLYDLKLIHIVYLSVFTFIPSIMMLTWNGKRGPKLKYVFYIYYPLHLTLLVLLNNFIN